MGHNFFLSYFKHFVYLLAREGNVCTDSKYCLLKAWTEEKKLQKVNIDKNDLK